MKIIFSVQRYTNYAFETEERFSIIIYSYANIIEWPLFLEPALKLVLDAKTTLPRRVIRFTIVMVIMSEKHIGLIVSVKEACQKHVREEKTLLLKRVARYSIVRDIMFVNQEDLT
jgi:hypothetical protein